MHVLFKLNLSGTWAKQTWVDEGDLVRVIGTFSHQNDYELSLTPRYARKAGTEYANMLIVEPLILVPVTTIVGCMSCDRETVLKRDFKDECPFSYPPILGNIVHEIF